MTMTIPFTLDPAHRRCIVGGEPMIFHCHHYNTYLQRSVRDAHYVDSTPFLIGAAAEAAHGQLTRLFAVGPVAGTAERKALAEALYRWAGFGTIDLSGVDENGGTVRTPHSHYATGWRSKWGDAAEPVCYFTRGWLAGAVAAIYGKPDGCYAAQESACSALAGHQECVFTLTAGTPNYEVYRGVGLGTLSDHRIRDIPPNNVDYEGILTAVSGMDLTGRDDGLIRAFGVMLTRHYANYYNRVSFELEHALERQFGAEGREVARPLLEEAGRYCAFFTYGGIMTSSEWDALIRPSLKTREDWVHGMNAVVNALGWGRWQVTALSEDEAEFVVHDDYESIGYLAMYGRADHPVCHLATGGAAGLMNLVYLGDIASRPDLTPEFYDDLFRQEGVFVAEQTTCKAMGDEVTTIRVTRG